MDIVELSFLLLFYFSTVEVFKGAQKHYYLWNHKRLFSPVTRKFYYVLHGQKAADLLGATEQQIKRLLQSLEPNQVKDPEIQEFIFRLRQSFPDSQNLQFFEIDTKQETSLAYTLNKTEGFYLCLSNPNVSSLVFLAIHELAHAGSQSFEVFLNGRTIHSPKFKKMEQFLYEKAENLGILKLSEVVGREHCSATLVPPERAQ